MFRLLSYIPTFSPFPGWEGDGTDDSSPIASGTSAGVQTPKLSESLSATPDETTPQVVDLHETEHPSTTPENVADDGHGEDDGGPPDESTHETVAPAPLHSDSQPADVPDRGSDSLVDEPKLEEISNTLPDDASKVDLAPPISEAVPTSPRRDDELWFEDGSLVLIAGDVEFRVYKGPLVLQSPVFKDMLSLPQPPPDSDTTVDSSGSAGTSCATVHLSDFPGDLKHFLRAFFGESLLFEPSYNELSAYIRLGHKYQCERMVQRSIDYLKKYYVDDFDLWWKVASFDPPGFSAIHCVGVVNLARLTGTDSLLPVALMACCMLGAELSQGFVREDGTVETLSLEDLTRCFVGKARLLEAMFVATHRTFRQTVSDACKHPDRCRAALLRLLHEVVENEKLMDAIRGLRFDASKTFYINAADDERSLCVKCYEMLGDSVGQRQVDQQREFFRKLPEMMGVTVEGWAKDVSVPVGSNQGDDAAP